MFASQLHLPNEKLHQLPSRLKGDRCLFLGPSATFNRAAGESAYAGKADVTATHRDVAIWPILSKKT